MENLSLHILNYLRIYKELNFSRWGTFYLKNTGAEVDDEFGHILPPSLCIYFESDFFEKDGGFAGYISSVDHLTKNEVLNSLHNISGVWKDKLTREGRVSIENVGVLFVDGEGLTFFGERIHDVIPEFFGLEEINLKKIKTENGRPIASHQSRAFNDFILYFFLLIIPLLGILILAYSVKDTLLKGKYPEGSVIKNSTHRIPEHKHISTGVPENTREGF
ncbi:MAG: hypothetical protein FDW93_03630 [Bergeyella sp.]|nr:hypothetical protein [Bergeyella sp.]